MDDKELKSSSLSRVSWSLACFLGLSQFSDSHSASPQEKTACNTTANRQWWLCKSPWKEPTVIYLGSCMLGKRNPQTFWELLDSESKLTWYPGEPEYNHGHLFKLVGHAGPGNKVPTKVWVTASPMGLQVPLVVIFLVPECTGGADMLVSWVTGS